MSLEPAVTLTVRPPNRLFRLVFESHNGRALVPIPKRSTSPQATSTLWWWIALKVLDPERPIREATLATPNGPVINAAGRLYAAPVKLESPAVCCRLRQRN